MHFSTEVVFVSFHYNNNQQNLIYIQLCASACCTYTKKVWYFSHLNNTKCSKLWTMSWLLVSEACIMAIKLQTETGINKVLTSSGAWRFVVAESAFSALVSSDCSEFDPPVKTTHTQHDMVQKSTTNIRSVEDFILTNRPPRPRSSWWSWRWPSHQRH